MAIIATVKYSFEQLVHRWSITDVQATKQASGAIGD